MTAAAGARNLLTDNPALYEARFPDPDHSAARFVDDILATYLTSDDPAPRTHPATVLDLGCGTGRDLGYLARRGYRCLNRPGFDAHLLSWEGEPYAECLSSRGTGEGRAPGPRAPW
ncbi:SAM-dependent methyltransferase [Rhodococcus ruber]|nr:SAM-dependent methyltransferase [Rhodococcus ruber]